MRYLGGVTCPLMENSCRLDCTTRNPDRQDGYFQILDVAQKKSCATFEIWLY